jgi:hypothetical protein
MVGQPRRQPAFRRHDKNVPVSVVVAREGDLLTVRRKSREALLSLWCTQSVGDTDVGLAQQACIDLGIGSAGREKQNSHHDYTTDEFVH